MAGLAEVGRNGVAPGPWTPWIGVGCSCGCGGRVSATGAKPAASNFPNLSSPSTAGSGKNSGACRAWTGGKRARRGSWCRGGAIAGFGRGYGVAELLDRGGARRGCALGFVVAAEEGRRVQGVAGRLKKGCRRSRRAGQEGKAAGITAGLCCAARYAGGGG